MAGGGLFTQYRAWSDRETCEKSFPAERADDIPARGGSAMTKNSFVTTIIGAALALAACAPPPDDGGAHQAVVGVDTYVYLRCNATGWNVDDATRLRQTADPYVFTLAWNVTQPWM